jgi:hypothetical protein
MEGGDSNRSSNSNMIDKRKNFRGKVEPIHLKLNEVLVFFFLKVLEIWQAVKSSFLTDLLVECFNE